MSETRDEADVAPPAEPSVETDSIAEAVGEDLIADLPGEDVAPEEIELEIEPEPQVEGEPVAPFEPTVEPSLDDVTPLDATLAPEPSLDPEPSLNPGLSPESGLSPEPEIVPEPEMASAMEPEPVLEPEMVLETNPENTPDMEPAPEAEPDPEPEPLQAAELVSEPLPESIPEPAPLPDFIPPAALVATIGTAVGAATDAVATISPRLADNITALFADEGFTSIDPPILQPLQPFLDLSGEDVRRRMYVTSDPSGREFCLRPDFTSPVALAHKAAGGPVGGMGRYAYLGPVFRYRSGTDTPGEFIQAGIEWYGEGNVIDDDVAILKLAVDTLARAGINTPVIRVGDVGLSAAFLEALNLPDALHRRLWRQLGRPGATLAAALDDLERTSNAMAAYPALGGLLDANGGTDAAAVIEDVLALAGVDAVGSRSPRDIADRFVEKSRLAAGLGMAPAIRRLLETFELVAEPYPTAMQMLDGLANLGSDKLTARIDLNKVRAQRLSAAGLDPSTIIFDCGFRRPLDYYTGFVFDLRAGQDDPDKLIGGGRYDALQSFLGAETPVPAIGFSLWLDRLEAAR
ncbi:MAG: ATP phosphoribosyltransferase regulatory subunit [Pseudomonadota bacterium]